MTSAGCTSTPLEQLTSSPDVTSLPDSILLSNLSVRLLVGVDGWERVQPQPVTIDARVHTDVSQAGGSDHLPYSIHYGNLTKELEKHCTGARYRSLEALAEGLAKVCIFICKAPRVTLKVQKPRSLLHARSAGVQIVRSAEDFLTSNGQCAGQAFAANDKALTVTPSAEELLALRLSPSSTWATHDTVFVNDLEISTILGVNPWERVDKQIVRINLVVYSGLERLRQATNLSAKPGRAVPAPPVDVVTRPQNYRTIVRSITTHVEKSNYKTVESLATSIAMVVIGENRVERIKVRVDKPSAIMFADCAGVEVERDRAFFEKSWASQPQKADTVVQTDAAEAALPSAAAARARVVTLPIEGTKTESLDFNNGEWHVAAIALGSNLNDRFGNIEKAVQMLDQAEGCHLVDTSFLYETMPMYVKDQPRFVNGACRIATRLSPHELLSLTQSIETRLGRDKRGVPVKGPRMVDLDILFYDRIELTTADLILPHPGITEREFVLRPLMDILPDYRHPQNSRTVSQLLSILIHSEDYVASDVKRVLPMPQTERIINNSSTAWHWGDKTFIMGIINATPDSFSDGGDNSTVKSALTSAKRMVEEKVDVLDVGGMSTAPNAAEVSPAEEIARVVPAIKAIRDAGLGVPISIDSFRASVARAAIEAGANIINDVSAGIRDPAIFDVCREYAVPIVLMHMRGDSKTMSNATNAAYPNGDVVGAVRHELEGRVDAALRAGVRRWNIILDPGVGFAKNQEGNLDLIRGLQGLTGSRTSAVGAHKIRSSLSQAPSPGPVTDLSSSFSSLNEPLSESNDPWSPSPLDSTPHSSLAHFPLLLGVSRKKFIGSLTGRLVPKERIYGTAAACTACIMAGADILRVHDVSEMLDVAKMADAIVRGPSSQTG